MIQPDQLLISLDVTALFTNISKELVIKGIEKRWNDISKKTRFSLPQFLHAIDLILSSINFSFNGQTYEQIFDSHGVPTFTYFGRHCDGRCMLF